MSNEQTQTVDPVSAAPAVSTPSAPPASSVATAAPQAPASNGTAQSAPSANGAPAVTQAAPAIKPEWDGNLESLKDLPTDQVEHAKSVRRYLTKEREKDAQRNAEIKTKAEQFDRIRQDPALAEFQQWKQSQQFRNGNGQQAPAQPQVPWTADELAEAQVNPSKLGELMQRGIQAGVQQQIQQYAPIVQQLTQKQAFIERSQEVQDFAEAHPDIWDLYDAGIMRPLTQSIVDSGKGGIAEAYAEAKKIEAHYSNRATAAAQGRVLEKKAAVTATPSAASEPSVIWVDKGDRATADRISFENALQDKKVNIRYKN